MGLWRRKQSTSSGESSTLSGTVTPVSSDGQDLSKSPSRLMKTLTGGLRSGKPKKPAQETSYDSRLVRPFTQQNLEHQKMFDSFTFSFGRRRSSHGARSVVSGISPSASRNASIDSTNMPHSHHQYHGDRRDTHTRFDNAFAAEVPQEVPGEESDKDSRHGPTSPIPAPPYTEGSSSHRNMS